MPPVDADYIKVGIEMPEGTPTSETEQVVRYVEEKGLDAVREARRRHPGSGPLLEHMLSVVGATLEEGGPVGEGSRRAQNRAGIWMMLTPSEERDVTATEIGRIWRELTGELPGVKALTFKSNLVHMGANLDIELAHRDTQVLKHAVERVKEALRGYKGVGNLEDTYTVGKSEYRFRLRPLARSLGITEAELGRQLRGAFYGSEALRLQRGRSEVKVMVRYPEGARRRLAALDGLRIRTPKGGEVPLSAVAEVEEAGGFSVINRHQGKRVVHVTADVDPGVASPDAILNELRTGVLAELQADWPGLTYDLGGENKEERESMDSMKAGFTMALMGIFFLLAVSLKSYAQPLVIMASIPFGLVGAVLGHLIMGYDLSILSMFGLVALTGVVVNDSLLLVDYVNRKRAGGMDLKDALVQGGMRRFRPILLTSLTTFFGLTPMILERSLQAKFLIPMAISLGFGILFATGITLILIPCIYHIYEDLARLLGLRTGGTTTEPAFGNDTL